ncbi:MAG: polysaccharide biosynthesis/export family protein, partial [Mariniphaga sp.]|nr:polysaccharide biosynthesis/export family protein [Mariniphaga sp.]
MKRFFLFILIATGALFFSSCQMSKHLTYFQDLEKEQSLFGIPEEVPEYRIRPLDNLYVNIQTLDEEVNQLYNSTQGNDNYFSGPQQMYAGLPSHYINGYQVETSGKITFPILGEIQVAGLTLLEAQGRIKDKALELLVEPT